MNEINLTLPVPPSVNRYWRNSVIAGHAHLFLSDEARNYKFEVKLLTGGITPFDGPVAVNFTVFRPRNKGDLDNFSKGLLDALKGILYHDDDQIIEIHAYRETDKRNPRVELSAWQAERP